MLQSTESVGENTPSGEIEDTTMVTNIELAKKVEEQEEDNKSLRERLAQMEQLLGEVQDKDDKVKEKIDLKEEKEAREKELEFQEEASTPDYVLPLRDILKGIKRIEWQSSRRSATI